MEWLRKNENGQQENDLHCTPIKIEDLRNCGNAKAHYVGWVGGYTSLDQPNTIEMSERLGHLLGFTDDMLVSA